MESEILTIQLIPNWGYDILITITPSLITGIVVGLLVGFVLSKRQKKDRLDEQRRKERVDTLQELIGQLFDFYTIFFQHSSLVIQALKDGNKKASGININSITTARSNFNKFILTKETLIDKEILEKVTKIPMRIYNFLVELKNLFKKIPESMSVGFLKDFKKQLEAPEKIKNNINQMIEKILSDAKEYRAKM